MIIDDKVINSLIHGDIVIRVAEENNVNLQEAREMISKMSFSQYHSLTEAGANITAPSGSTLGQSSINPGQQPGQAAKPQNKPAATAPQKANAVWSGQGPIEVGMEVGVPGQGGKSMPSQVSTVDMSKNGVQIKNPVTGKVEWMNISNLQPGVVQAGVAGQMQEDKDLARMRKLAGIGEDCSGGASGAGGIAVAAKPMGTMNRRQPTEEMVDTEYTPKVAKTVIGDTKPNQATGKLSADLAANGRKSATRPPRSLNRYQK